ncbi:type III polyketide synthase [Pelagovum pacificum]|uniref:Type III polyketide synthase n=1 Tax=Pelagovum pacificum TaxID=2588711 RepID=A0A5C5GG64_9RHOB|nr:3-oxoacyl-[acyl-carrier-protein] synthase III C-terminal domain-containing protein [Pelagovum pacificum]QQA43099.1 type III polyketide synthase [Pelagovum pacificum]TNY33758.1 type III polyketide synthase [Pelagovum pacificum]
MQTRIHSVSTAVPPHLMPQDVVADTARDIFGQTFPEFDRLSRSFRTSGVETRHSVAPLHWFREPRSWKERNALYLDGARALFFDAAGAALERAGWQAEEVDTIVTVSSTGIATPTLEAQVAGQMGFRDDVMRVPVFGLGCAGGVSGLSVASELATARPGSKVLLVVIEACTVSFRPDRMGKADLIAAILFGDGAAAACLSTDAAATGPDIRAGRPVQKTWPDTLDIMGWDVDDTGLGVIFHRSIPDFVNREFAAATDNALAANELDRSEIDRFICHPGGARVVEAIEAALDIVPGSLAEERDVLRQHGNMSAPTVLFVLEAALANGLRGQTLTCALGPGFTASFLPLSITDKATS